LRSFEPPRRIFMGPGPSDVSPRVLAALARPTIGHLDPAWAGMLDKYDLGDRRAPWHVRLCLTALTEALAAQNYPDVSRATLAAAETQLAKG
jgi:hypothetical protein